MIVSLISSSLVLTSVLVASYLVSQIVYQLFLSPLHHVPGPFLAKLTPYYLIIIDTAGYRTSTIHKLHHKYGTAVRVGPSEISFSNVETVKELYGQATPYMKAPWYEQMSEPPLGIFSLTDRKAHSERRRLLSHVFAQGNLIEAEPLIAQQIQNLKGRVQANLGKPLNMLVLFRSFSLDVVGELFLGKSFDALKADTTPQFLHDVDFVLLLFGIKMAFPWLHYIIERLPFASVRQTLQANDRIAAYGKKQYYDYIDRYGRHSGRRDLLTKFMALKPKGDDTSLTDLAAYREVGNLIHAGTDTTSTTLTYLFWELARQPTWQDRLRKELRDHLADNPDTVPTLLQVQELPVLDAIINEALRLHPAAPASLPRVVPAGGRVLDGHFIPEKTVVSMQCYTTQRDPTAFSDPETFDPARWLDPAELTDRARELFMPFSKGTRACIGKNLAMMELKLAAVALVRRFRLKLAESATEDCMMMTDHFLVIPKGGKCELIMEDVGRAQ